MEEQFIRVCQSLYQEVEASIVLDGQQQKLSKVRTIMYTNYHHKLNYNTDVYTIH